MAGYYVEQIAMTGCVGLITTVTQPLVHPLGGTERLLGTNPVAIAIPIRGQEPLLLDFATSEIAYGSVLTAKARGETASEWTDARARILKPMAIELCRDGEAKRAHRHQQRYIFGKQPDQ